MGTISISRFHEIPRDFTRFHEISRRDCPAISPAVQRSARRQRCCVRVKGSLISIERGRSGFELSTIHHRWILPLTWLQTISVRRRGGYTRTFQTVASKSCPWTSKTLPDLCEGARKQGCQVADLLSIYVWHLFVW